MSLFARNYSWADSPEKAAYSILEAKIAAERATGVGETTDITLIRKGQVGPIVIPIQEGTMTIMKSIWDELRPREFGTDQCLKLKNTNEFEILRKQIFQPAPYERFDHQVETFEG